MVKICQTGLLKLNFETRPKKRIFRFLPKISAGHGWSWKFFFANFQILGPLGCQGWLAIPQNVKKSQNHCTLCRTLTAICAASSSTSTNSAQHSVLTTSRTNVVLGQPSRPSCGTLWKISCSPCSSGACPPASATWSAPANSKTMVSWLRCVTRSGSIVGGPWRRWQPLTDPRRQGHGEDGEGSAAPFADPRVRPHLPGQRGQRQSPIHDSGKWAGKSLGSSNLRPKNVKSEHWVGIVSCNRFLSLIPCP